VSSTCTQATATPNVGRFMDLAAEVVHRQGVIFISSAGEFLLMPTIQFNPGQADATPSCNSH
jgi:hypothetical protein